MSQFVDKAIARSISHNEIVTVEGDEGVRLELFEACEGDTENGSVHEYWGTDADGDTWRVHVHVRARFDRDAVNNEDIRALSDQAALRGDREQVRLCKLALEGDSEAAERCIDAIESAAKSQ